MSDTIPDSVPQKQCIKCKKMFPATSEYFLPRKDSKDGLRNDCRTCFKDSHKRHYHERCEVVKANRREYYQANKEAVCAKEKVRRQVHKDEIRIYRQQYYKEHREEQLAHSRELNRVNKEKGNPYAKAHYRANKERYYAYNSNRRALIRGAGGTHTAEDIQAQFDRQKGRCYYCHKKVGKERSSWNVDHVVPVTRGGSNDPSNLVIACKPCNDAKRAKMPHEWPEGGRLM